MFFLKKIKFNRRFDRITSSGFTLIETLVAIAILSAALASPMVLAIRNVGVASVSQDQLVAFYLGQEVLEYVRNIRDTNILSGREDDWLNGLEACQAINGCRIDVAAEINPVEECLSADDCETLKFNQETGLYNYDGESDTNKKTVFIRTIKIEKPQDYEAIVKVSVKWTGKYGDKKLDLQDNVYNWR